MELVYVEWEDAGAIDPGRGWVWREDLPAPIVHMFRQVGFVVDMDPTCLILTEAYSTEQMAPRTRIPLGMIRRFVYLDPDTGESVETGDP